MKEKRITIEIPETLVEKILSVTGNKKNSLNRTVRRLLEEGIEVERKIKELK